MSNIIAATFEGNSVRVRKDENGNAWFVAKDICDSIGLQTAKAVQRLEKDDVNSIHITDAIGRSQEFVCVNESGLYSLILGSRKEEARRFKKWVTSEVLPSIRKTGSFSVQKNSDDGKLKIIPAAQPVFDALTSVAKTFGLEHNQALLYANKATIRETGVNFQNILQIELKSPDQARSFTPTELGARIGLSAQKFNSKLSSLGLQEKKDDVWCATESGKKYSVLLDAGKKHSDGTPIQQLKWLESVLHEFSKMGAA